MEINDLALVVFFVTICIWCDKKVIGLSLAILILMWTLMMVNVQQLISVEGMRNNGNSSSLTVYLLFLVLSISFIKGLI